MTAREGGMVPAPTFHHVQVVPVEHDGYEGWSAVCTTCGWRREGAKEEDATWLKGQHLRAMGGAA